jgi:pimeloyl-ACP methyl ester carboxylesterase
VTITASTIDTPLLPVSVAQFGSGAPVVYLHDVLFDQVTSAGEAPEFLNLLSKNHEIYAPALPGFQDLKQLSAVAGVEDYVLVLADVLDGLALEGPHVVGTGFGGWLAAELAVERPTSLRTLTLINAFGLGVEGHPTARFFDAAAPNPLGGRREVRELLFAEPSGAVAQELMPDFPEDDDNERFFTNVHAAARLGWSPPAFYDPQLLGRLGRIRVPTHVVWGRSNQLVDVEHAHAYEAGIAGAHLTVLDGAGAAVVVEQPDDLAKAVISFIDQLDGAPTD